MVEVKGSVVNSSINDAKTIVGDQVFNAIISQLDSETRQLFEKPILDDDWYPLDHYTKFLEQSKLTKNDIENVLENRSGAVNEKGLKSLFRIFVRLGSPEVFIRYHSFANKGYFRGISIKKRFERSNKAIITYTGFEKQHRLIQPGIIGFYRKALEILGANDIRAKFITPIEEDKDYCELEITWT